MVARELQGTARRGERSGDPGVIAATLTTHANVTEQEPRPTTGLSLPLHPPLRRRDEAEIFGGYRGGHAVVEERDDAPGCVDVDASRIAVVGHSRNGKTALLAGAFDERIAIVIPLQAGCGGTAPSRTSDTRAESVKRINTSFPHWFDGNFKKFNDDPSKLPFDQHCLIALCAPRP